MPQLPCGNVTLQVVLQDSLVQQKNHERTTYPNSPGFNRPQINLHCATAKRSFFPTYKPFKRCTQSQSTCTRYKTRSTDQSSLYFTTPRKNTTQLNYFYFYTSCHLKLTVNLLSITDLSSIMLHHGGTDPWSYAQYRLDSHSSLHPTEREEPRLPADLPTTHPKQSHHQTVLNPRVVGGRRKRSWSRAVFTSLQRKGLEKRFSLQKYVNKPDRRQLAAALGLTDAQVNVVRDCQHVNFRNNFYGRCYIVKHMSSSLLKPKKSAIWQFFSSQL